MSQCLKGNKIMLIFVLLILLISMSACNSLSIKSEDVAEIPEQETETADTQKDMDISEPEEIYVQPEMSGEISVNVYEYSEWLETAVLMFVEKYPDMKVNIHSFYNGTDVLVTEGGGVSSMSSRPAGQTREDYIAQLNTQLLSGKADDIVITSTGLPLGRYVKMGIFADISFYLESAEEINEMDYYMNIFDAYRTKSGALYQLPISATAIPLVCFDKELMDNTGIGPAEDAVLITWREALDIGKEMYDASTLMNTFMEDARAIVGNLFTKAAVASIDYDTGKVEIDKERMLQLLSVFEELEDYQTMPEGFDFFQDKYNKPYGINYQPDTEAAMRALNGYEVPLQWKYDDGEVYLSPYYALDFGITNQSKNKELAWEFLRYLISEEVQTLPSCPHAGVSKKGLQARVEGRVITSGGSAEYAQKVVAMVDGWVSQITAYRAEDTDLIQISEGTLEEFIDGSLTTEETIDKLINRLEQYMNE